MKVIYCALAIGLVIGLIAAACQPETALPQTATATPSVQNTRKEDWQQRWDTTLAEAKKEGVVSLYVIPLWGSELRTALSDAFKAKYGIGLEFSPLPTLQLLAKVKAEQNAGLYLADVFGAGSASFTTVLKPSGVVGPIEPMLMLPEVLDSKAWAGGQLFDYDQKDHMMIGLLRVVARTIAYNTNMVKESDINSYKDLLKPQFKGQIALMNPTDTAGGTYLPNHFINVYGWDEGLGFLRDLIIRQKAAIITDARLHVETVARGKYSVSLGGSTEYKADFMAVKAPIAIKIPAKGDYVSASLGGIGLPTKFAHPNATTIFVNWLLSREGQSVFAKASRNPSRRLDASTEGIDPVFIPLPGEKLVFGTPELDLRTTQVIEAVKGIMAEAAK